ncbi:arylamine N-acetyltransferase family protein [Neobacillus kokaensis]|uniref:Acetyltransferase YvcN n=1 Tax=Neobacillus kokaensis TaxID=2759023 RepID=A0ABQ3N2R0_9BACI|nr:arylamine N-acetyltransferase [Neobacillus kokaensis]GHH99194.1 putative acetyltransferase YvcN [Neobacillus kokaensis]
MSKLASLFHQRIGIWENEKITFEKLNKVLEKTATSIPFENRAIMGGNQREVTKENLTNKILEKNQGGLCYELNPLLYYYLLEHGFNAALVTGVVFNQGREEYTTLGRTHVAILLDYEGERYLIDTGFGGNLPLKPVPLSGETVSSSNGEFRIKKADIEQGDYVLEMKLKHKDSDWRTGYAFDSRNPLKDSANLNEIQTIITEHPESSFNKHPLLTRLTESGNITLTDSTFTQWMDGNVTKENIDQARFKELAKEHFGM